MSRLNPPFRADHVGSLLRPGQLVEARERYENRQIDRDALRHIEDECIREVVKKQEAIGLDSITDGEFRRAYFHTDFLQKLQGITIGSGFEVDFHGKNGDVDLAPPQVTVTAKLRHVEDIQSADFQFLKSVAIRTPKVTIPSPTMVHFRGGRQAIDTQAYPDMDEFFADLAQVYRDEIDSLYKAGCRYIQLDDTNLAYLCDPKLGAGAQERGLEPNQPPHEYAALINAVIDKRPQDLTVALHLCRGSFESAWIGEGGYEPVAEVLFNELNVDAYFLEYDDERSGNFAPLRFVPARKTVVVGLVSTKVAAVEPAKAVTDRVKEASRYVPLENMCLSPQCGFASTVRGHDITEAVQWAKLELITKTARDIWDG